MATLPEQLRPLMTPVPYQHPVSAVRLIETHVSWLFLTGEFAYKVKRPVQYPFVDLRLIDRRAFFCEEELRLSRRFAPELYLDICPIRVQDGRTRIGGAGETIEYALRMRQFDCEEVLDRLVATRRIDVCELETFGRDLASRQATLPAAHAAQAWGSPFMVRKHVLENIEQCVQLAAPQRNQDELRALTEPVAAMLALLGPRIAVRGEQGRVRECHGDLHARNVVRYRGRLLAFDCMEFEPGFRWIDVAEEVAFLWMDLHAQGAPVHAHAFLSGFLAQSGDFAACPLLRLYAIHRALVRAKVAVLEAAMTTAAAVRHVARAKYRDYLNEVRRLLEPRRPTLLLMYGRSGSGKTWIASRLAPLLDAVHLRSDIERKRLAGLGELDQSNSGIGRGIYSRESDKHLMGHLLQCAADALSGGYTVIVDATFRKQTDRERFRKLATELDVGVRLIACHAPKDVLESRVRARQHVGSDASEADLAVLAWQESHADAIAPQEDQGVILADTTRRGIVEEIHEMLRHSVQA